MPANRSSFWGYAIGIVVTIIGVLCLHYTNGAGIEHHAQWAEANGLPKPEYWMFFVGAAMTVIGSGVFGWSLRRTMAGRI